VEDSNSHPTSCETYFVVSTTSTQMMAATDIRVTAYHPERNASPAEPDLHRTALIPGAQMHLG
jgi:hypothetical protein